MADVSLIDEQIGDKDPKMLPVSWNLLREIFKNTAAIIRFGNWSSSFPATLSWVSGALQCIGLTLGPPVSSRECLKVEAKCAVLQACWLFEEFVSPAISSVASLADTMHFAMRVVDLFWFFITGGGFKDAEVGVEKMKENALHATKDAHMRLVLDARITGVRAAVALALVLLAGASAKASSPCTPCGSTVRWSEEKHSAVGFLCQEGFPSTPLQHPYTCLVFFEVPPTHNLTFHFHEIYTRDVSVSTEVSIKRVQTRCLN